MVNPKEDSHSVFIEEAVSSRTTVSRDAKLCCKCISWLDQRILCRVGLKHFLLVQDWSPALLKTCLRTKSQCLEHNRKCLNQGWTCSIVDVNFPIVSFGLTSVWDIKEINLNQPMLKVSHCYKVGNRVVTDISEVVLHHREAIHGYLTEIINICRNNLSHVQWRSLR